MLHTIAAALEARRTRARIHARAAAMPSPRSELRWALGVAELRRLQAERDGLALTGPEDSAAEAHLRRVAREWGVG